MATATCRNIRHLDTAAGSQAAGGFNARPADTKNKKEDIMFGGIKLINMYLKETWVHPNSVLLCKGSRTRPCLTCGANASWYIEAVVTAWPDEDLSGHICDHCLRERLGVKLSLPAGAEARVFFQQQPNNEEYGDDL